MTSRTLDRLRCSVAAAVALLAASCSAPAPSPPVASPAVLPGPAVLAREPWSFAGASGVVLRTGSYRLYTTEHDPDMLLRMPVFLEAALAHYRTAITPLPAPPLKLDTFLMATRDQWVTLTRQVMGPQAPAYLLIQRGGFSSGGRALLWSIGPHDTLSIAAHEGWHQYTQRTLRHALPVWAEEALATYMEGYMPDPAGPLRPVFAPWANVERFDQLRAAALHGSLMSLADVLGAEPQTLLGRGTDDTLTYYAQVWALALFLMENEGGVRRPGLEAMLRDAAASGLRGRGGGRGSISRATEAERLWNAYWPDGLAAASAEYAMFVDRVARLGDRDRIIAGKPAVP